MVVFGIWIEKLFRKRFHFYVIKLVIVAACRRSISICLLTSLINNSIEICKIVEIETESKKKLRVRKNMKIKTEKYAMHVQ